MYVYLTRFEFLQGLRFSNIIWLLRTNDRLNVLLKQKILRHFVRINSTEHKVVDNKRKQHQGDVFLMCLGTSNVLLLLNYCNKSFLFAQCNCTLTIFWLYQVFNTLHFIL